MYIMKPVECPFYFRMKTSSFCTGEHGSKDGERSSCQMLQPVAICLIDDDIYIGERGTYGGGIRKISSKGEIDTNH